MDEIDKDLISTDPSLSPEIQKLFEKQYKDRLLNDFAAQAMSALISRGIMAQVGIAQSLDPNAPDTQVKISRIACLSAWKIAQMMLETKKEAGL